MSADRGAGNLLRPREMTAYATRQRSGRAVDGRIEPTPTRLLVTRIVAGVVALVGLGLAAGFLGPRTANRYLGPRAPPTVPPYPRSAGHGRS